MTDPGNVDTDTDSAMKPGSEGSTGSGSSGTADGKVERVLDGLLSRYEAPVLQTLSRRMPPSIMPDHLTAIGIVGSALTAAGCLLSWWSYAWLLLAVAGLALNWFGDSLDGTLARYRKIERPHYGFYLDHMSDVVSQIFIVLGLGLSPLMRFETACLALIVYFAYSIHVFTKLHVTKTMQLTFNGIGPTEIRAIIAVSLLLSMVSPDLAFISAVGRVTLLDIGTLVLCVGALIMLIRNVVSTLQHLAREELQKVTGAH